MWISGFDDHTPNVRQASQGGFNWLEPQGKIEIGELDDCG
jgi:hypothetical protein